MIRLLFKLAVLFVFLFVAAAFVAPFVLGVLAAHGPRIALTISTVSPSLAMRFNGWVYGLQSNPLLAPSQEPVSGKIARDLDFAAGYVPQVSNSAVRILGTADLWLALIGIAILVSVIVIWRRGGITGLVDSFRDSVGTPLGLISFFLLALVAILGIWIWQRGVDNALMALRPVLPLIGVVLLAVMLWRPLRSVVMGGLALLLILFAYSVWVPEVASQSWIRGTPVLSTVSTIGASISSRWDPDTVLISTLIVLIVGGVFASWHLRQNGVG
jgi:hypothetical protein